MYYMDTAGTIVCVWTLILCINGLLYNEYSVCVCVCLCMGHDGVLCLHVNV